MIFIIMPNRATPALTQLWTTGQYDIRAHLFAGGMILADVTMEHLDSAQYVHFETCRDFRYFKILIYQPSDAFMWLPYARLSSGENLILSSLLIGNTFIAYTTEPWSAGRHYLRVSMPNLRDGDGAVRFQIIGARSYEAVSYGLKKPPVSYFMPFEIVENSITPNGLAFEITNNIGHDIFLTANYWIYGHINNFIGLLYFENFNQGDTVRYEVNWGADLPRGSYILQLQHQIVHWTNHSGTKLWAWAMPTAQFEVN